MSDARPFERILALVDGSDASARAVDFAIGLARAFDARLTLLAVVETETLRHLLSLRILSPVEMTEFETELMESARAHLAEARRRARQRGVEADEVAASGNGETVVPREARARRADLAVVGAFQSAHAAHDLAIRQRQSVVDHAPCHVLVVK